jgi:hypothetical protein
VIVLAALVWLGAQLLHRPPTRTLLFPSVLALGAVVSLALTGWRRSALTGPSLSRYAYITVVLVLPLLAAATDWAVRRVARARFATAVPVVIGVLLVLIVGAQVRMFDRYVDGVREPKRQEKASVLTAAALVREHHDLLGEHPAYTFEPQVTVEKIAALDRAGDLPALDGLRLDDRLTVLGRLNLLTGPTTIAGLTRQPAAVRLGPVRGARSAPASGAPDCVLLDAARAGATARLLTKGRVAVGLQGDGPIGMRVTTRDGAVQGLDVYATLEPDLEQVLNIGALDGPRDGGAVLFTLPKGTTRVCGVS